MPMYTFEDVETGEGVDLMFPSATVPKIGDVVHQEGRKLRRTFSGHLADAQIANCCHSYPRVSRSLPKGCCPESQTPDGKPILKSRSHEDQVLSRTGYIRDCPGRNLDAVRAHEARMRKGKVDWRGQ